MESRQPYNELNGRRVEIVGEIKIGTGFAYNGLLMTSEATLTRLVGWPEDQVSFGLVQLDAQATDSARPPWRPGEAGPSSREDVGVYTRDEINGQGEELLDDAAPPSGSSSSPAWSSRCWSAACSSTR